MKKIIFTTLISFFFSVIAHASEAEKKCRELDGFKKIGKGSAEFLECLTKSLKKKNFLFKINTKSKLTDVITGKKKLELPNPIKGIKKIGEAVTPKPLSK